jgi:hypothetical protein
VFHQNANLVFKTLAVNSSTLLQAQRTYVLCANTTFNVGLLEEGAIQPVGGGFPLAIANPNMHIKCQVPGTCILEGNAPVVISLFNATLLAAFLNSQNAPPLPADYRIDTSNLLVEGLVFREILDRRKGGAPIVNLPGFGRNMTIKNCLWKQANASFPPQAAISLVRPAPYGPTIQGGGSLYSSLLLDNCTFRDNVFDTYLMYVQVGLENLTLPSLKVTMVNVVVEGNSVLAKFRDNSLTTQAGASTLFDFRDSMVGLTDLVIKNNTMKSTRAAIVLTNSYFGYSNLRFGRNVIEQNVGRKNCTDVARITRFKNASAKGGYSIRDTGCIEFDANGVALKPPTRKPTVKPPPTPKPTRRPSTTRPTRRPTTFGPNLFSPVE